MTTATKKLEVKTTAHIYKDTLQKIRVLASFDSRDLGKNITPADYLKWMVDRAYEAKVYNNKKHLQK